MAVMEFVQAGRSGAAGLITLARPKALNALSLDMIRDLTGLLLAWRDDPAVQLVALRGSSRDPADASAVRPFGAFCAGGDIRFFHQAAGAGDPALEDFFTEEYRLNHLIHHYAKPVVALMDGIVMGGGMGIAQGARHRVVTERTRMAMPETGIGLFPDVGGGYFLSRCAGHTGEYLALTGCVLDGAQAVAAGLADHLVSSDALALLWERLASGAIAGGAALAGALQADARACRTAPAVWPPGPIERFFGRDSVAAIVQALEADADRDAWACDTATLLRQRSPLMLQVTLEQIRRARTMSLAQALRLERGLMRHCFHPVHLGRSGASTEVVEGIRALAIDKDHQPRWNPARIADVQPQMVAPFFESPWPAHAHPLRDLA